MLRAHVGGIGSTLRRTWPFDGQRTAVAQSSKLASRQNAGAPHLRRRLKMRALFVITNEKILLTSKLPIRDTPKLRP